MRLPVTLKLILCALLLGVLPACRLTAQNLTLEGQTGGFLTPTAYVVYADKGQFFSHPAIGFHYIDASAVIGNVETFSVTESFASRAEAGFTRIQHQYGDQPTATATAVIRVRPSSFSTGCRREPRLLVSSQYIKPKMR